MKVLVIDDHPLFRMGVSALIRKRWPEAAILEAETMDRAETLLSADRPDLIILDLSLPDAAGTQAPARALELAAGVPILVVSASDEVAFVAELLQMGVNGYVAKDRAGGVLSYAIARVVAGGRYVTPEIADRLVGLLGRRSAHALPHETLSDREYNVMLMIAAGRSLGEIGEALSMPVQSVAGYRERILMKSAWQDDAELIRYCDQHGLVEQAAGRVR